MIFWRNVFLKYGLGAKRPSEIWFGCETSFWNMVWVRNVFLKYGLGAKRLPELWRRGRNVFPIYGEGGRNVFPKYELGARRLTKKWCELTMGRKVCVPLWTLAGNVLWVLINARSFISGRSFINGWTRTWWPLDWFECSWYIFKGVFNDKRMVTC